MRHVLSHVKVKVILFCHTSRGDTGCSVQRMVIRKGYILEDIDIPEGLTIVHEFVYFLLDCTNQSLTIVCLLYRGCAKMVHVLARQIFANIFIIKLLASVRSQSLWNASICVKNIRKRRFHFGTFFGLQWSHPAVTRQQIDRYQDECHAVIKFLHSAHVG